MEPPGGRGDSRFNLAYSMNLLSGETATDIYGTNPLGRGPQNSTSLPQMTNTRHSMISTVCGSQRNTSSGMKSNTPESCYDEHRGMTSAQSLGLDSCGVPEIDQDQYTSMQPKKSPPSNGKKTKGRVKIKMEYIENKLRRYTTFSKRKTGIMKKAYELSTLTGTQVMLLVASETGHVYTFATRKLQPMITSEAGKALIQTCLNSPDPPGGGSSMGGSGGDQRMSATGFEETELTYNISDDDLKEEAMSPMGDSSESSGAESSGMQPEYESTNLLDFKGILANNNTTISSITTAPSEIKISSPSTVSTTNSTTPSSAQTSLTSTVTPQSNGTISNLNSASGNTSSPIAGTLPPGLTVYQTPQGAVYATTTSTAGVKGASAGVLLSLQSTGPNSQPHFITIPLQVGAAAVAAAAAAVSGSQPPPLVTTVQQKDQKELDLSAKSATTTMSGRK